MFLAGAIMPGQHPGIWTFPVTGGPPRRLRDDAFLWDVSPDGSFVAFTTNEGKIGDREVWLMAPNGSQARKVYATDENSRYENVRWSPDGRRLAYYKVQQSATKIEMSLESRDLKGGPATTILSGLGDGPEDFHSEDFYWLPDGRVIYSSAEPDRKSCNLWEMRVDTRTGEPREKPKRLTNWAGFCMANMSATSDGKRLAFSRGSIQDGVYVAELEAGGDRITTPHRLTASDGLNYPSAWTPDSSAVIFESDRNGQWGIFKQSPEEDTPEPIVAGLEDAVFPILSPDGAWILYSIYPNKDSSIPVRLMRVPEAGGRAQLLMTTAAVRQRLTPTAVAGVPNLALTAPTYGSPRCAKSPSTLCAIAEVTLDGTQLIFSAFDPVKGRGRELTKSNLDPTQHYLWSLSPDGTRIAVLEGSEGRIRILPLTGQQLREVVVKGWDSIQNLDWAADGRGFFISSYTERGSVLLHVDLEGKARALWHQKRSHYRIRAVPSPDSRHIAMSGRSGNHNIWLIENF
jgi:Tol biopolymer transport system component